MQIKKVKRLMPLIQMIKAAFIYLFNSLGNVSQGVFTKVATTNFDIALSLFDFLIVRSLIGIIFMLPFAIKYIPLIKKNRKAAFLISLLTALDVIFFNMGLRGISINLAVLIMFLIPIWINFLSPFILKEKFEFQNLFFLIFGFIGVFVASPELNPLNYINGNKSTPLNIYAIFIFINTFCVAFGLILQKKWANKRPIPLALLLNNVFMFGIAISVNRKAPTINIGIILLAALIAIFDIMEFFSAYYAYQLVPVARLQPIRFTRIIISAILGYIFLHETTTANQIYGAAIIILANISNPVLLYIKQKKTKSL